MIPGRLHNAAVTTVWRKRNEPGCRISNFPIPTFTRADGWCKKSNFPSLSFARADIWCKILNFPSLFEREQIRKVRFLAQTQRKRGFSPVFAFGKFEILHQTRNPPAQKLPTHTRSALLCRQHGRPAFAMRGDRSEGRRRDLLAGLYRQDEGLAFAMRGSCSRSPPRSALLHREHEGFASAMRGELLRRPAARLARRPILPGRRVCLRDAGGGSCSEGPPRRTLHRQDEGFAFDGGDA